MKGEKKSSNRTSVVVLIGLVLVTVIVIGGVFVLPKVNLVRPYSAVHLETGDIYFGKLSYFPRLSLSDVYTVQTALDPENPNQPSLQVVPLSESIWSPEKIILSYDKIVFIGRVGEDSQLMQAIRRSQNNLN